MTERARTRLVLAVGLCSAAVMLTQAFLKSPVSDEVGQFYASVATVRYGDPAYYRVNPPLHRWVSGVVVEALCDVPIPRAYPASMMVSGVRAEFPMGTRAIEASPNTYGWHFLVGRMPRIAIVIAFAWVLMRGFPMLPRRSATIAAVLYLTSPMTLGHGWTMMPDALSACAMMLLMVTTLRWLNDRTWINSILVGIAWGVCLNTKFTFCPIYLLWPGLLVLHEATARQLSWGNLTRLGLSHFAHGVIALLITIVIYEGRDVGVPMRDHLFASNMLLSLANQLGSLPSPLPAQYLMGIDEQQLFIERGVPSYFNGTVYPEGVWWYYVVGVFAKEQFIFLLACAVLAIWLPMQAFQRHYQRKVERKERRTADGASETRLSPTVWFLIGNVAIVFGILSWNSQMALNVRYLFPGLPACYLLVGIGVDAWLTRTRFATRPLYAIALTIIAFDLAVVWPHNFAYINPLFGGSYRVPPVLHDSNFDGGQDVWTLERWDREHPVTDGTHRYYAFYTDIARSAINLPDVVPSEEILEALVRSKSNDSSLNSLTPKRDSRETVSVEMVIARCLQVPAPWHRLWDQSDHFHELLHQTATIEPDEFISPTMLLYRFDTVVPNDDRTGDSP